MRATSRSFVLLPVIASLALAPMADRSGNSEGRRSSAANGVRSEGGRSSFAVDTLGRRGVQEPCLFIRRRRRRAAPKPKPKPTTEVFRSHIPKAIAKRPHSRLWTKLEEYDERLKGETFHDVAKRLVSFFRKSGDVRNFTRAMRESGTDIKKLADPKNLPANNDARGEMKHHGSTQTVETRNRREMLGRKVDQWTYGYEYEQLGGFLKGATKSKGGAGGRMLNDYKQIEADLLEEFWSDCTEIHAICQLPKTKREKEGCIACAEEVVRRRCLAGRDSSTKECKGSNSVVFFSGQRKVTLKTAPGQNTFFNWLGLQIIQEGYDDNFHRGNAVTNMRDFEASIIQNMVDRRFLPNEVKDGKSTDGKQFLDSLPVTGWQRCILFNPYHGNAPGQIANLCDNQTGDMKALKDKNKGNVRWQNARLFKMILADPTVQRHLKHRNQAWINECRATKKVAKRGFLGIKTGTKRVRKWDCKKEAHRAKAAANKFFGRNDSANKLGMAGNKRLKKAGGAISAAVGPIVGKLLGMLLKAAGLYETMKTLARAAGMTPAQGADCEDAEYRREVMKLPAKQDNKRGCLLKVFAKNFVNVLESIIVMLGNKLVDWAVDLLRTALQGVKSAIISAAGSVPFAGGFLAALVDIGWELLMNFGAKMLLKGFVVAKLPEWLQVRKLAKLPWEKVLDNPIVQVVAGIILQLIESAMTYGDKSWMAVGIDSVLNTVQVLLQDTKQYFWIRALTYAKKEMRSAPPSDNIMDQLLNIGRALIGGFGTAISRRLDTEARDPFDKAIDEIKGMLTRTKIEQFKGKLMSDPVKALTELIGQKIGPVVMPVVTSLVPMPPWAKTMLNRVGTGLSATLNEISQGGFDAKKLVGRIVDVLEPVAVNFLEKLPIADQALKTMLVNGFKGLAGALKQIDQIEAQYLKQPWRIVEGIVSLAGDFLKAKVGDLIKDPRLGPERDLLKSAVGEILGVLGNKAVRDRLFAGGRPNLTAILTKLAEIVRPYAKARLGALAAQVGLEGVVGDAVDFLFGPQGPLVAGRSFFTNLPNLIKQKGQAAMAAIADVASGLLTKAMGTGMGGGVLGSMVKGVLGMLGNAMKSPGGLTSMFKDVGSILKSVVDLVGDFLRKAPNLISDPKLGAEKKLLASAVDVILKVLSDANQRRQLFSNPQNVIRKVAELAKPYLVERLGGLAKSIGLEKPVADAIDFMMGPQGPLLQGAAFFRGLPNLLKTKGQAVMAQVATIASGLIQKAMGALGKGPLGALVKGILETISGGLSSPGGIASMFKDVNNILKSVSSLLGGVLRQAPDLIKSPKLGAEKQLLASAVDVILKVMGDPRERQAIFASPQAVLSKVADLAKPYLVQRLTALAKGIGMEGPVTEAVNFLMGPQGPLKSGAAFFRNLPNLLKQKGQAAMAEVTRIASGLLTKAMGSLGSGPLGSVVKGILESVGNAMRGQGGLASAFGSPQKILKAAKDAVKPLIDSLIGQIGKAAQASPIQALLKSVTGGVMSVLDNPQQLVSQGVAALKTLAQQVATGLKGMLTSLLAKAIPDQGLRGLIGKAVDGFFNLVSDPTKLTSLTGAKILDVLKSAGAELFGYLKGKALALLGQAQLGPVAAASKGILNGILTQVQSLIGNPTQLKSLVEGGVKGLISAAGKAIGPALSNLVESAVPASLKAVVKQVLGKVTQVFTNPGELGNLAKTTVQGLLAKIAPTVKSVLEGILKSVVPANLVAKVSGAVEKIRAALANPAGLLQQAGQAARKAIDETLASLVLQIQNPTLRDVAANLVALIRDLVSSGSVGNQVRSDIKALLGRLLDTGIRAITNLVPAGVIRTVVGEALGGLKSVLTDPKGVGAAFAAKAATLLPRLQRVVQRLLGDLIQRFLPDPAFASALSGLAGEILELVSNPGRWRELLQKGLGFLLSRGVPIVRDLVMAALGRVSGLGEEVRSVISGLLTSATKLFENPSAIASFAKNAVSSLVSMGVGAIVPLVTRLVQKIGSPALTGFVERAVHGVADLIRDPAKLKALFSGGAKTLIGKVLGEAKRLLTDLAGTMIHDPTLKQVASQGLGLVLDFVEKAIAGGANLGAVVKDSISKVIPVVANLVKEKLLALFPASLESVKEVVARAFDGLVSFGSDLLKRGQAAWTSFTQGGAAGIFGRLLKGLLPMVTGPITRMIPIPALQGAVTQILEALTGLIGGGGSGGARGTSSSGGSGSGTGAGGNVLQMFLGEAKNLLGGLVEAYVSDPTLKTVAKDGLGLVVDFVQKISAGGRVDVGAVVKDSIAKVVPVVANLVKDKLLGIFPGHLQDLRTVVAKAFDGLVSFGSDLLKRGQAAWTEFTQGGAAGIFGRMLKGVLPMVTGPVLRAIPVPELRGAVTQILEALTGLIGGTGGKSGKDILKLFLGQAKTLLASLVKAFIQDPTLKSVAEQGLGLVVDFVEKAVSGGTANMGQMIKQSLAKLIPVVAKLLRDKLLGLFPHHLGGLKTVIGNAFDELVKFGSDLLANPQQTWQRFTAGGGGQLFGKILKSVIPLVKEPVVKAVGYPPLKGLLGRLLDAVGELLSDPGKLIGEFRKGAQAAMALLLPQLDKVLGPFAYDVIVRPMPKGIPRDVVGALIDAGRNFLSKPGSLQDFIRTAKTNGKELLKKIINGLAPALLRSVPSKALQGIFKAGIDMMVQKALGGTR